ncbi:MAG: family beta-propeller protein [Chlorobi bacterium]|nr:family beta-propeller protein [Chlorobiota bacterium]
MRNHVARIASEKVLLLLIALLFTPIWLPAQSGSGYRRVTAFTIGGDGGWDYATVDPVAKRLYLSHSDHVEVVNIGDGSVVGTVPNTAGVHGVALAPALGRGFTSNGRSNSCSIFDLKTLKVLKEVKTGGKPDAILYDATSGGVFVFNGKSTDVTVINAATGDVMGTIPLEGGPEFAVSDGAGHVFFNVEDKSDVGEIDVRTLKVIHYWKLGKGEEPTGLAIDAAHRRLFVGCHNNLMAVMNADNGNILATLPIGSGVDATAFDPGTGLAFASNGDGTLTVIHEDSADRFTVIDNVATERGARTMALDPITHNLFLPTARFEPAPAATAAEPHPRPKIVSGSFMVLEYAR